MTAAVSETLPKRRWGGFPIPPAPRVSQARGVSHIDALSARVDTLQAEVDEAERYARACRAAIAKLREPARSLAGLEVHIGPMRSRSVTVDRARARADAAGDQVDSVRSRLADALSDLDAIARIHERRADRARLDLRAASVQLAYARAGAP